MSSTATSPGSPSTLPGDPPLAHQITITAGSARLSLEGDLDLVAEPLLELLLDPFSSTALVIVDLSAVTFISCGVLRKLLDASRHTRAMGGRFVVVPSQGAVRRLFDLIGAERELEVVATPPDPAWSPPVSRAQAA